MKLHNEFTVSVPLDQAWDTLLDIRTVAGFLPGATLEEEGEDGVYRGTMRVKVGPMAVSYQGSARLGSVDEASRTVEIAVEASELKGQGTAAATVTNRLVADGERTRVIAETDLQVTGRQAQFGRGIMQDVAGRMLGEFARRFEEHLTQGPAGAEHLPNGAGPATSPAEPEALDLGSAIAGTMVRRYAGAAGAGVLLVLLALLLGRRRS
jgi:hypothetical protein